MKKIGFAAFLLVAACQRENNHFTLKNPPSGQAACYEVGLEYCLKIVECEPPLKDDKGEEAQRRFDITECFSVVGKVCAMDGMELKRDDLVRVYDECLPALRASDCSNYEAEGEKHCPDVETEQKL